MGQAASNIVAFTPKAKPAPELPPPPRPEIMILLAIISALDAKALLRVRSMIDLAHFQRPCDETATARKMVGLV